MGNFRFPWVGKIGFPLTALDRVSLADLVGSDARLHEALGLQAAARAIAPITIVRPPAGRERR